MKMRMIKKVDELNTKIFNKDANIKRVEEDLAECKVNKHFLDIIAMQAGKKKPADSKEEEKVIEVVKEKKVFKKGTSKKVDDSKTFMTSLGNGEPEKVSVPQVGETKEVGESDLTLNDPYEDDDFNIYFDKQSLLAFMTVLEEDNLFKIHLVDEDELKLKATKLQSIEKYKKSEFAIEEVSTSVNTLDKARNIVMQKF